MMIPTEALVRQRIRTLYQETILECVRHAVDRWWDLISISFLHTCADPAVLRKLLRDGLLQGSREVRAFLRITRALDALGVARNAKDEEQIRQVLQNSWVYRKSAASNATPVSVRAVMDGLLALHAAELHSGAEGMLPALRDTARRIWESGRENVDAKGDREHLEQILRMLCHFDLLDEARNCLELFAPQDRFCKDLDDFADWKVGAESLIHDLSSDGERIILLGVSVWGPSFLAFFRDFHLPSLLAPGNLPALAQCGKVVFSILTDAEGLDLLRESAVLAALERCARVQFTLIDQVPERVTPQGRARFYRQLGLLDHRHVHLAQRLGADLILLPPDVVLSGNGLGLLLSEVDAGCDACSVGAIETYTTPTCVDLEGYRTGDTLNVPSEVLLRMAVMHKTDTFRSLILDASHRLDRHPREFFWRVPGGYVCHSIFMHPFILSSRVMARPFHPNYENVDWALLPRALQADGKISVLEDASPLFMVHCTEAAARPDQRSEHRGELTSEIGVALMEAFQGAYAFHRRLFSAPQFFPVEDPEFASSASYTADQFFLQAVLNPLETRHG